MDNKDDDIVDLRARMQAANKPVMRVNRDELRANGGSIADRIPSFLAEIEKANRAQKSAAPTVTDPAASSGFELGESEAKDQVHVEMDIVAGILEEKQPVTHTRPESEDSSDEEFQLAMPPAGTLTGSGKSSKPLQIRPDRSSVSSEDSDSGDGMRSTIDSAMSRPAAPATSRRSKTQDDDGDDDDESGSSSSDASSSGSSGRRRRIVLRTHPSGTAAATVSRRASSASSTTSSSGSSASSEDQDGAEQDGAHALSPSPVRLATRKRTQSPATISPVVDKISGSSSPTAIEDRPKKKKKTKKLIEEVE